MTDLGDKQGGRETQQLQFEMEDLKEYLWNVACSLGEYLLVFKSAGVRGRDFGG